MVLNIDVNIYVNAPDDGRCEFLIPHDAPLDREAMSFETTYNVRESSSDTTNLRHPANRTDRGCSFRVRTIYRAWRRLAVDTRDSQIAICGSPAHNRARARALAHRITGIASQSCSPATGDKAPRRRRRQTI